MRSTEIRSVFLDFFTERGHRLVPSASLVSPDPALLLNIAGMNQFKPYFTGERIPEFRRATSAQKCVRTVDLDNVGRTTRHGTFFEMLGNFSFGDYFRAETIAWAWELCTGRFGLDRDRLWITVHEDDDEAERLWRSLGVPASRIQRLGRDDNYWSMGVAGPCGPSSEIHYDRGPSYGPEGGPAVDGERYQELWNLVFMQYLRDDDFRSSASCPPRTSTPASASIASRRSCRTSRTSSSTDLLAPVLEAVRESTGRDGVSARVVTDHARTAAFLIADGVLPSNEGRGYVLRRLMRRAMLHARLLGAEHPVLPSRPAAVVDLHGETWPELREHRSLIEQDRDRRGGGVRAHAAAGVADPRHRDHARTALSAKVAFELHDTYGFPFDLTRDAAHAAGLDVDEDAFTALLEESRRRSRSTRR